MEETFNEKLDYILDFPFLFTEREKDKILELADDPIRKFDTLRNYMVACFTKRGNVELVDVIKDISTINFAVNGLYNKLHAIGYNEKPEEQFTSFIECFCGTVIPKRDAKKVLREANRYFDSLQNWERFKAAIETCVIENVRKHAIIDGATENVFESLNTRGVNSIAGIISVARLAIKQTWEKKWLDAINELANRGILINSKSIIEDINNNFDSRWLNKEYWKALYFKIIQYHLSSLDSIKPENIEISLYANGYSQSMWCLDYIMHLPENKKDIRLIYDIYKLVDTFVEMYHVLDDDKAMLTSLKNEKVNPQKLIDLAMKHISDVPEHDRQAIEDASTSKTEELEKTKSVYRLFIESKKRKEARSLYENIENSFENDSKEYKLLMRTVDNYIKGEDSLENIESLIARLIKFLKTRGDLYSYPCLFTDSSYQEIEGLITGYQNTDGKRIMDIFDESMSKILNNPLYGSYGFENSDQVLDELRIAKETFDSFLVDFKDSYLTSEDVRSLGDSFYSVNELGTLTHKFSRRFNRVISKKFDEIDLTGTVDKLMKGDIFSLKNAVESLRSQTKKATNQDLIESFNTLFRILNVNLPLEKSAKITRKKVNELKNKLSELCEINNINMPEEWHEDLIYVDNDLPFVQSILLLTALCEEVIDARVNSDSIKWDKIIDELYDNYVITEQEWKNRKQEYRDYLRNKKDFNKNAKYIVDWLNNSFNMNLSITEADSFDKSIDGIISGLQEFLNNYQTRKEKYRYFASLLMDPEEIEASERTISRQAKNDVVKKQPMEILSLMSKSIHNYSCSPIESFNIDENTLALLENYNERKLNGLLKELLLLAPCLEQEAESISDSLEIPTTAKKSHMFIREFNALDKGLSKYFERADKKIYLIYRKNAYLVGRHEKFGLERYLRFVVNYLTLLHFKKEKPNLSDYHFVLTRDLICTEDSELSSTSVHDFLKLLYNSSLQSDTEVQIADLVSFYLNTMYNQNGIIDDDIRKDGVVDEHGPLETKYLNDLLRRRLIELDESGEIKDNYVTINLSLFIPEATDTEEENHRIANRTTISGIQERMNKLIVYHNRDDVISAQSARELIDLFKRSISAGPDGLGLCGQAITVAACVFEFIEGYLGAYIQEKDNFDKLSSRMHEAVYNKSSGRYLKPLQ